jgi:hypothetical protein
MKPGSREWVRREILVTAKGYPNISINYKLAEVCCVAGITAEGEWTRIWPVLFRELPYEGRPGKYDIIRLRVKKHRDFRRESFIPDNLSFERVGHLDTKRKWAERKKWVLPYASASMCEIQREADEKKRSLGMFKPREVYDLTFEDVTGDWSPKQVAAIKQYNLFGKGKTPLEKIPMAFKYRYICADAACPGHTQTIIDWEICALYRRLRYEFRDDVEAIKNGIKKKFLTELCGPTKDTYFFVGDMHQHPGSFLVLGVFWPPK